MFCCVRGYGGRRAWRTALSPTRWTPFLFRPLHAWLVWCWPAYVWSVYGHVVAAAVVLLVHGCVSRLMVGLFGVGSLALLRALARSDVVRVVVPLVSVLVGRARVRPWLGLCCLLGRGWCCAGAWPPSWWGLLRWCVAPPMVGRAVLVRASRPLWGVLCRCVAPPKVGAVLACGPPHCRRAALLRYPPRGGACSAGAWPPSWWGTLCWGLSAAVVVRGVVVLGLGCRRVCHLGAGVGFGLVVLVVVFEPAPCAACFVCSVLSSAPYCRRVRMGVVGGWIAVVVVLITWRGRVLCLCAAPLMVGRTLLVRAPPPGGACCVGFWPPSWWGALCWCVPPLLLGCAVLVPPCRDGGVWFGLSSPVRWVVVVVVLLAWSGLVLCWCVPPPPPVGACRVCACPPPWWGLLWWRVRVSVRDVVAGWMLGLFCWFADVSVAVRPALSGVCCLWCLRGRGRCCVGACPPLCWGVPCLCVPPPLGGACCVGVFGFWFVVLYLAGCSACFVGLLLSPPPYGRRCWVLPVCGVFLAGTDGPASRARVVRLPFVLAGSDGPASRARAVRHSFFLFRGCRRPAARGPLLARVCAVPGLAPVFVAACCCAPPPHPTPPFRLLCPAPPSLLGAPAGGPPPLPGGMPFPAGCLALVYPCCLCALWLAVCWRFLLSPPPRIVSPGCWPLPLVFPCPPASALLFPCLWPWHLFGLVSFSPLGSCWCPPPPPGGCSWWSAVPRVLFCGAVVRGGLLCAARGVLLRRTVLLCGCLAVWCARLLCR